MNETPITSLWEPLVRFWERTAYLFPVLFAVLVVIAVGLLAAWLLEALAVAVLRLLRFDVVARRLRLDASIARAGIRREPSALVGQVVRWIVILLALAGALSILSSETTDDVLASLVGYLPRLGAGLLIFFIGWAVSRFVSRSVLVWAVNARLGGARWLAGGVQFLVALLFVSLALEHLGFGREIALTILTILLGGGVFAVSLALGLAGREPARRWLRRIVPPDEGEDERDGISHL